jgi:hypothetical protein
VILKLRLNFFVFNVRGIYAMTKALSLLCVNARLESHKEKEFQKNFVVCLSHSSQNLSLSCSVKKISPRLFACLFLFFWGDVVGDLTTVQRNHQRTKKNLIKSHVGMKQV